MRIAVLANLKDNAPREPGMPPDRWDDLDSPRTTSAIVAALQRLGHEAAFFEASIHPPFNLIDALRAYQPDLCFNLSESHYGSARESQVPALLEMLRLPYTGAQVLGLALALDKSMTKRLLHYHGLPTPEFQLFHHADDPIHAELLNEDGELRFPLFVKPNAEGTSIGVGPDSIVHTVASLRQRVAGHLAAYRQPILVERFIAGREVLVGMVGNVILNGTPRRHDRHYDLDDLDGLTFLPALEIDYAAYGEDHAGIYTNDMKLMASIDEYHYHCPAALTGEQLRELQSLAAAAFLVTGCHDVARVDFRLDANDGGKPYILEINPLPGLSPGYSDLCLEALAMGWDHDRLVGAILEAAIARHGLQEPALAAAGD
jgi:D-alanine-D-alanine ligase